MQQCSVSDEVAVVLQHRSTVGYCPVVSIQGGRHGMEMERGVYASGLRATMTSD